MKKILGLDLGTNSIGWALVDYEAKIDNQPEKILGVGSIIGLGSRIIPMSQDVLGKFDSGVSISQTAERTGFRGVRRLRERHLLRRERLHRVLNILNFLPAHYSTQIDFIKRLGQYKAETEPKLVYDKNNQFIFKNSFEEMYKEFTSQYPKMAVDGKKIPYDWTIYFLRKKALTEQIEKEELAWLLLNFNQKRGYFQLRGEDEEENPNKKIEFHSLVVTEVTSEEPQKGKAEIWYNVILENGWIYRRSSKVSLSDWIGKTKEFVVTTDINDDGSEKSDKDGKVKRSFRAPAETDWTLVKTKTEQSIERSDKTVGQYIYDTLLENPSQKINGKLVRVIERKFYKVELEQILKTQQQFHAELKDENLYNLCIRELYEYNEAHRNNIAKRDFVHLFLNDIIFYQRPLKSKKSLISNCKFESRKYLKDGIEQNEALKCISKSHPLFQEFRLWQWIQNLHIFDKENDNFSVTGKYIKSEEDLVNLFEFLNDRKEIEQKSLLKYFKLSEKTHRWNYVDKPYPCNETRGLMLTKLSKCENVPTDFLTAEIEEALWHILYSVNDKIEVESALKKFAAKHNLNESFVEQFKKYPPYKNEYGSYSAKAIKKLLPIMRMGKYWNESDIHPQTKARIEYIIDGEFDENIKDRVREKAINLTEINHFRAMPLWLVSYIVYDRHSEDSNIEKWKTPADLDNFISSFKQHSLRNPIVEQVITETLRVVKDIWVHYGKGTENFFDEIHIELGREMKNPADKRKQMTEALTANESTNLRIKALLAEMINYHEVENVRPYSPMQQEILKIYENSVLNSGIDIDDDILKISKTAQPSKADLLRYKLWLEQKYRSPYTGEIIPLNKLFTPAYEIEHIIPQSRYFDDSFSNKVICESEINKEKDNKLALEYIQSNEGKKVQLSGGRFVTVFTAEQYEQFVKNNYAKNYGKAKKLMLLEIPEKMIERQMNDTRYISKEVKNLLSKIVRQEQNDEGTTANNLLSTNGQITTALKQDWGLHEIWNELISPRFERLNSMTNTSDFGSINPNTNKFLPTVPLELQKGFSKKRIDHRHHALDALVIACATRNHINYLNNQNALDKDKKKGQEKRDDLKRLLCYKKYNEGSEQNYRWIFKQPWEKYAKDAKHELETTVISFKQNLRVINKTVNKYQRWESINGNLEKVIVKQTKGESWAIRKPLHKDTVSGLVQLKFKKEVALSVAIDNLDMIVNKKLRSVIKKMKTDNYDKKLILKHFKEADNKWNDIDVSRLEIYFWENENVASRVKLDESFNMKKIESITDQGIQKILSKHISKFATTSNDGKLTEHPELAFSPEGVDELNEKITTLNNGHFHHPIIKVSTYEPKGNKFHVGTTGNKNKKFVEAAKGTNLFFAIYIDDKGKRNYASVPFNEVLESQKQSALLKQKPQSVPLTNANGDSLLFHLSPNDMVYVPTEDEIADPSLVDFNNLNKEQVKKIYKFTDGSDSTANFIPSNIAALLFNMNTAEQKKRGFEFKIQNELGLGSHQSKNQNTMEGIQIKSCCLKLEVDRLGNLRKYNSDINAFPLNKTKDEGTINVASEPTSNYGINSKIEFYKDFDDMENSKVEYAERTDVVTRLRNTIELIKRVFGDEIRTQLNEKVIYFKNSPT